MTGTVVGVTGFLGLGSNLAARRENLGQAVTLLNQVAGLDVQRVSSIYESPAQVPPDAPDDWCKPYLNLVVQYVSRLSPQDLLAATQAIEVRLGRTPAAKWAPRLIDIDMLSYGDLRLDTAALQLPHPHAGQRGFVLAPLAELQCDYVLPGQSQTALQLLRQVRQPPAWMQIVNLTPDSFSGDGSLTADLDRFSDANYIDIGAESTRPGAAPLDAEVEWQRLAPVLARMDTQAVRVRPRISVDTRHAATVRRVLELGVDVINDVGGLVSESMLASLVDADCDVVLMHSLSVPADPQTVLPAQCNPVTEVFDWFARRLQDLARAGIAQRRVILDPGIGFGKTAAQSWRLLRDLDALHGLDCRLLVGHSRKSFLGAITRQPAAERDIETLAGSNALIERGVDILRVHNVELHQRYWHARYQFDGGDGRVS